MARPTNRLFPRTIYTLCLILLFFVPELWAKERVILAFGDSLTAGLGLPKNKAYPAQLEAKLRLAGRNARVINAGISGETTAGGRRRIGWTLKSDPDIVILELGANDGLRGLSLLEMEKNLSFIIEAFQARQTKVILAGMKVPLNYGRDYRSRFEAIYPRLAEKYSIPLIPFFLEGVATESELNQRDGLHPTEEGYTIVIEHILPFVESVLEGFTD